MEVLPSNALPPALRNAFSVQQPPKLRPPALCRPTGDNCSRAVAVGALVAAAGGDIAELGEASLAKAAAVIAEATQAGDTLAARA